MAHDQLPTRDKAWSLPPDQQGTRPTERKIGEGMLNDGPNGQNSTPPMQDLSQTTYADPTVGVGRPALSSVDGGTAPAGREIVTDPTVTDRTSISEG